MAPGFVLNAIMELFGIVLSVINSQSKKNIEKSCFFMAQEI